MTQAELISQVGLEVPPIERVTLERIEVDVARSQVRGILYDRDRLEQYQVWAELGREPDEDHVPVLAQNGDGPLKIISGAHTVRAFQLAEAVDVPGRIVKDPTPKQVEELAVLMNVGHGAAMSQSELLAHGVELVTKGRQGMANVARKLGIRQTKLQKAVHEVRVDVKVAAAGVDTKRLSKRVKQGLHTLTERPQLLTEAARLIADAQLQEDEALALLKRVQNAETDAAAMEAISAETQLQGGGARTASLAGSVPSRRPVAVAALRKLQADLLDHGGELEHEIAKDDSLVDRMAEVATALDNLVKAIRKR